MTVICVGSIPTWAVKKVNDMSKNNVNTYDLSGEYGIGYTSKGVPFFFDKEDYELIVQYKWWLNTNGYIYASCPTKISMHRLVMGTNDKNVKIDHIHHNKTDNRKSELRIVTDSQNQMNSVPRKHSSICRGVSWHKKNKKWIAQISVYGKLKYLGLFEKEEDAIRARKKAEELYYKEFAYQEKSGCRR